MNMQQVKRVIVALLCVTAPLVAFTEKHEGFGPRDKEGYYIAYADPAWGWRVPTACSGATRGIKRGDRYTKEQCEEFLRRDLEIAARDVKRCVKVPITQAQFDALTDFNYNTGAICKSELVRKLNNGMCFAAAEEFNNTPLIKNGRVVTYKGKVVMKWTTANGIPLKGLIRRRAEEREMFEEDC